MSLERPNTGHSLYRQHKKGVEKHNKTLLAALDKYPDADAFIEAVFFYNKEQASLLKPQEKEDIFNFAKYAAKRLTAGAITSKVHEELIKRKEVTSALERGAPVALIEHDIVHAMVAFARNRGRSLTPAYLQVEDEVQQFEDPVANEEEMMVFLFQDTLVEKFLAELFRDQTSTPYGTPKDEIEGLKNYEQNILQLQSLKEKNIIEYFMKVYQEYWKLRFNKKDVNLPQREPMPEFHAVFKAMYENSQKKNTDPVIAAHEFLRIVQPLILRLRNVSKKNIN